MARDWEQVQKGNTLKLTLKCENGDTKTVFTVRSQKRK